MAGIHVSFDDTKVQIDPIQFRIIVGMANMRYETAIMGSMIRRGNNAASPSELHQQAFDATVRWMGALFPDLGLVVRFSEEIPAP